MSHDNSAQQSVNNDHVKAAVLLRFKPEQKPIVVEIDGQVFTRAKDPDEERRAARLDAIGEEIEALAGPHCARANKLLAEIDLLWASRTIDVHDYVLRQVGYALMEHGLGDLWRLLYAELGSNDDKHRPAAAADFLHGGADVQDRGSTW